MSTAPWIVWRLWKVRNDFCFKGDNLPADQIVARALFDSTEWLEHQGKVICEQKATRAPPSVWKPPVRATFKCNIDASWVAGKDTCSVGWILRDDLGNGKWYGAKTYRSLPNFQP